MTAEPGQEGPDRQRFETVFLIPTYNEERTILDVLERSYALADLIVVVDDGSRDDTSALLRAYCKDHPKVSLLTHTINQGMSGALLTGLAYLDQLRADSRLLPDDVVVMMDADGQHLPEESTTAVAVLKHERLDVLLGRRDFSGYPRLKRIGNRLLTLWARLLSGFPYQDVECGFRVMRIGTLSEVLPYFTGRKYGCAQELAVITARRGLRVQNRFPTTIAFYRKGARLRDGFNNLVMGFRAFVRVRSGRRYPDERLQARTAFTITHDGEMRGRTLP